MKKRELWKKTLTSTLVMALALAGPSITLLQPNMVQAASYYSSAWNESGSVSVHDPSIITTVDEEGKTIYYIFGSHMAWAKSYDLKNWTMFRNNINTDYESIFKTGFDWSKSGHVGYAPFGNLWAPDIIWNEAMGKWCMYMSVNGDSWNSSICLLTADNLEGDWEYVDTIIYSGFSTSNLDYDYKRTDYQKVTGDTELADRYITGAHSEKGHTNTTWDSRYGAHAIDPCVRYDEEGRLWMAYGSWSGGIYMIELDKETGLRDLTHKYETVKNESDAYMGIQIAGGNAVSGEAPYIRKIGDYYYLFVSYGWLGATGGYNVRTFRSENLTGPYVDSIGNSAIYPSYRNNVQGSVGHRLMSYYQWSWASYGEVAQGHNSAFVDDDGKAYIVYHTRATNHGEEHKVRVHQLYQNENGWLVEAPFSYTGETINPTGYSSDKIIGTYEVIFHGATTLSEKEPSTGIDITLNADNTVTCATDKTLNGTWKEKENSYYMTIKLGDTTFHGVFTTGTIEGTSDETLCFTAVADSQENTGYDGLCIWGVRLSEQMTSFIQENLKLSNAKASIEKGKTKKLKVNSSTTDSKFLKKAVWKSSNKAVATVNSNGKVTAKKAGKAKITATVCGKTMTCNVTVVKAAKKTAKK